MKPAREWAVSPVGSNANALIGVHSILPLHWLLVLSDELPTETFPLYSR
jgi:hypothetical protein